MLANKEDWNKLVMAAKMVSDPNIQVKLALTNIQVELGHTNIQVKFGHTNIQVELGHTNIQVKLDLTKSSPQSAHIQTKISW